MYKCIFCKYQIIFHSPKHLNGDDDVFERLFSVDRQFSKYHPTIHVQKSMQTLAFMFKRKLCTQDIIQKERQKSFRKTFSERSNKKMP